MGYDLEVKGYQHGKKREEKLEDKKESRLAFYFEGKEESSEE